MFPSKQELRKKRHHQQQQRRKKKQNEQQIRATEVFLPSKYIPPVNWKEAAMHRIPTDECDRTSYLSNVNALCEYAMNMRKGVPMKEAGEIWRKILLYRFKNRGKILEAEHYGRESMWQAYMTLCRVKFVAYGASWGKSSKRGSEFGTLHSSVDTSIVIDTNTPIQQYTLRILRLAIFQLQKEWKQTIYSEDLVSYIDHLERRVCVFLSGTFPARTLNYAAWCSGSSPVNGHKQTNSEFLTMMEILFHEIRYDIYHYHRMFGQISLPLQEYRTSKHDIRERLNGWITKIAGNVYGEVVLKEFRDRFIESQIRIGEREYYSYKNDEEGISHNPQSVISYFRADELGVYEEISDYEISKTLEIAGDERDIMIFSVLEFYYSSLHPGEKTEDRSFQLRYFALDDSEELSLEKRNSPVILRLFHRISVYDPSTRKLTMCGDLATAISYWLKVAFNGGCSNVMEKREPELKEIHDYIFKSIDDLRKRELEFNSVYDREQNRDSISEWTPS